MLSSADIINKLMSGNDYNVLGNLYSQLFEMDYKAAIEFSNQCEESRFRGIIRRSDVNKIEDILVKNGFSYSEATSYNLITNAPFFFACLKKDPRSAFEYFGDVSSLYDVPSEKLSEYSKYASFNNLSKNGIKKVCHFLNAISYSEDNRLIIDILDNYGYSLDLENKLLQKIGAKSLEERIFNMCEKENDKDRKDMSIYDLLVIEMYGRKKLHENGIDYAMIDIIDGLDKDAVGNFSKKKGYYEITVSNENMKMSDVVFTLLHECYHAIQNHNRANCDMIADGDIDLYAKDGFLGARLKGKNYYHTNYYRLSEEFNAEFKAHIELARLLGYEDKEYEYYRSIIGKKDIGKEDKFYEKNISYDFNMYRRIGLKKYHINDLMEEELSFYMQQTLDGINELKKKYPLFLYEYDFSDKYYPKRRTVEQLVDCINRSSDKKDKVIYKCLLKSRFDINKEKKSDIKQSIEDLQYLVGDGRVSEEVANMLLNQVRDMLPNKKNAISRR